MKYKETTHICSKVSSYPRNEQKVFFSDRGPKWLLSFLCDAG